MKIAITKNLFRYLKISYKKNGFYATINEFGCSSEFFDKHFLLINLIFYKQEMKKKVLYIHQFEYNSVKAFWKISTDVRKPFRRKFSKNTKTISFLKLNKPTVDAINVLLFKHLNNKI